MIKVALLSDTHGFMDDQILDLCAGSNEIWHAGDIGTPAVTDALEKVAPVRAVYGNIDGASIRSVWPLHQRFKVENCDFWITHIGGYPNRYDRRVRDALYSKPPQFFICGHSHILKVMRDQKLGLMHLNPGAIGKQGFHKKRTLLRFKLAEGRLFELEVVELER